MKHTKSAARTADIVLGVFTALLAVCVIVYGAYMLLDNYYAGRKAFISQELLVYRPDENSASSKEQFEALQKINADVNAWLTLYNTNIDFPVAQGKDDIEYLNKDIYKKQSLTGSIYLSSANKRDYSDDYNVIFGHHIANGGMFGDLDRYENPQFFMNHRYGVLQTPYGNYDLKIFAFLKTHAYDDNVYFLDSTKPKTIPEVRDYISKNAENFIALDNNDITKIIALSTCAGASTNGRIIVFANATRRTAPVDGKTGDEDESAKFHSVGKLGHEVDNSHWALLNLICVIGTLLTLLPLVFTRKKYHQLKYAKNLIDKYEENDEDEDVAEENENEENEYQTLVDDLKKFIKKMRVGIVIEIAALIIAAVGFIHTEDITQPVVIRDEWTGIMVLIFALSLLTDVLLMRYRGERPPEEEETEQN